MKLRVLLISMVLVGTTIPMDDPMKVPDPMMGFLQGDGAYPGLGYDFDEARKSAEKEYKNEQISRIEQMYEKCSLDKEKLERELNYLKEAIKDPLEENGSLNEQT
ncbi:MAG TPA: hypothetical protein QGF02_01450 [Candidatus Babeliales bacterium]|nr:hypothetical protein [Candidatus Babeliales bacterium]